MSIILICMATLARKCLFLIDELSDYGRYIDTAGNFRM
jgi:hypothetical protein